MDSASRPERPQRDAARDMIEVANAITTETFAYHGSEGVLVQSLAATVKYLADLLRQNGIVL